jgi:hypothetical protein
MSKADFTGPYREGGQWRTAISTGSSFTTGLRAVWNSNVGWGHTIAADFNADGKADLTSRYHKVASGGRAMSFRL